MRFPRVLIAVLIPTLFAAPMAGACMHDGFAGFWIFFYNLRILNILPVNIRPKS